MTESTGTSVPTDSEPTDEQAAIQARARLVGQFAGYLTEQFTQSVAETDLRWTDVVYAAGMACRALASLAVIINARHAKEGAAPLTDEDALAAARTVLDKGMAMKVAVMKMDSMAEMEAFVEGQEKGFH